MEVAPAESENTDQLLRVLGFLTDLPLYNHFLGPTSETSLPFLYTKLCPPRKVL